MSSEVDSTTYGQSASGVVDPVVESASEDTNAITTEGCPLIWKFAGGVRPAGMLGDEMSRSVPLIFWSLQTLNTTNKWKMKNRRSLTSWGLLESRSSSRASRTYFQTSRSVPGKLVVDNRISWENHQCAWKLILKPCNIVVCFAIAKQVRRHKGDEQPKVEDF